MLFRRDLRAHNADDLTAYGHLFTLCLVSPTFFTGLPRLLVQDGKPLRYLVWRCCIFILLLS